MTTAQSIAIYSNGENITQAKLTATTTGGTVTFQLGLSDANDGTGITWEAVTSGSTHTFTATGTWLYWRATGSAPAKITDISVEVL